MTHPTDVSDQELHLTLYLLKGKITWYGEKLFAMLMNSALQQYSMIFNSDPPEKSFLNVNYLFFLISMKSYEIFKSS